MPKSSMCLQQRQLSLQVCHLAAIANSKQLALPVDPSKGNHPLLLLLDPILLCVIG